MGWFSNLFSAKPTEEHIDEKKLEAWFRIQTSDHYKDKEEREDSLIREFEERIKELGTLRGNLEAAELRNKKIPTRMLTFMEGNRENYLHQLGILIENIPSFGPEFAKNLEAQLDIFAQKTQRNYAVLQEFFKDETNTIAKKIREVHDLAAHISNGNPKFLRVENTLQKIGELASVRNEIAALRDTIAAKYAEVADLEKRKEELQQQIAEKKQSPEFEQVLSLQELIKNQERALREVESHVVNTLAPFSKLVKKYEHATTKHQSLLKKYNEDPVLGLIDDTRFTIVDIIHEAVGKAKDLCFADKELEKIKTRATALKKETLHTLYSDYVRLKDTVKKAERDVHKIKAIDEVGQLNTDRDSLHDQIQLAQAHKKLLEQKILKMEQQCSVLRTTIEEMITTVVGRKIVIG